MDTFQWEHLETTHTPTILNHLYYPLATPNHPYPLPPTTPTNPTSWIHLHPPLAYTQWLVMYKCSANDLSQSGEQM